MLAATVVSLRCAASVALLVSAACSCSPLPSAPSQPWNDARFEPPAHIVPPGMPDDAPERFALQPGDVLRLRTLSVDPLDVPDLAVDPAGFVHVPLAGDVGIGGLGLSQAEARIEAALRPYDHFARASLSVMAAGGHRATVVGAVERPGPYELKSDLRVAELMALAGGPKSTSVATAGEIIELADLDAARVVRAGAVLPVSVGAALRGEPMHNVRLRAGDLVYVPPSHSRHVSVLGEVRSPKNVPFHARMRLTEALAAAGGSTQDADNADVRVVRGSLASPRVYRASLKALVVGKGGDVELAPGDVVFVTEHWFATTTNLINRLVPALGASALGVSLARAR